MRDGILARMKPDKNFGETAARLCQLHMEAGNSLATASSHRGQYVTRHRGGLARGAGNVVFYCCCCCCCCLLLLLLAAGGRRSAWAAAIPMLVQCTYTNCIDSQEKKNEKTVFGWQIQTITSYTRWSASSVVLRPTDAYLQKTNPAFNRQSFHLTEIGSE